MKRKKKKIPRKWLIAVEKRNLAIARKFFLER